MASSTRASSRRRPRAIAALIAALAASPSLVAHAGDPALAESLFREGRALMEQRRYADACPKLAESQRLDPGSGTMLALALCHERQGKVATAWAEYNEAATLARTAGRADREQAAKERAAALEPGLSRLTVTVSPEARAAPELEVRRNGAVLREVAWGTPIPVDPGEHVVEATARGKHKWRVKINVTASRDRQSVVVPALADDPAGAGAKGVDTTRRTAGFIVGGVAVAALGVGTVFGVMALSKRSAAEERCGQANPCPDPAGVGANDDAKAFALTADIALGAGLCAAGVSAFLLITSRSSATGAAPRPFPLRASASPRGAGLSFETTW
jgi:hypothetical protein